jgi:Arc/MetJ family transcription regulator
MRISMRTTLDIDRALLEEAAKVAGEKNLSLTVNKALAEYVRRKKLADLRQLIKETTLDDHWREDEEVELEELRKQLQ